MSDSRPHSHRLPPSALERALDWLASPPSDDPLRDLAPLRSHLAAIATVTINPLQYLNILELFQTRANYTASVVKPLLLDATLPVPKRLRTVAHGLTDVHGALASGYLKVLRRAAPEADAGPGPARLCVWGLANLAQKLEVAQLVSSPGAPDVWRQLLAFHRLLPRPGEAPAADIAEAELHMKAMLALCAVPVGRDPGSVLYVRSPARSPSASADRRRGSV